MRAIIIGAGEVGYYVADRLSNEQHDVVVVDVDSDRLAYVETHLDVAVLEGSGANQSVLQEAGIDGAGLLVAVTSVDEVNLVCAMSAREHKNLLRVARVSNPDFYENGEALDPGRFGVDLLINPERELAAETFRLIQSSAASDLQFFANDAVALVGVVVQEGSFTDGKSLAEIGDTVGLARQLVVAVQRDGETIVPEGDTRLQAGDLAYVTTARSEVFNVLKLAGHERSSLRRVMLAGSSLEAYYLAKILEEHDVQTTLLVSDPDRAHELAEKLEKTLILKGDPTEVELLEFEGVAEVDSFVALTDEDDKNIISSLVARDLGARQVITLVNKTDYLPLARHIGLDAAVSPRISAANAVLRYVRRGSITRVAALKDCNAEMISFIVAADAPVANQRLADIDFPDDSLVAAIVRESGRKMRIPRGADILRPGDEAIVFALGHSVPDVTKLFPS